MTGIESWAYEMAILLTGLINLVELGAQTILYQLIVLIHKIPYALSMVVSIRVGTLLGAGETAQAVRSAKLSFVLAAIPTVIDVGLLYGLKSPIATLFTDDNEILSLVISAAPICAMFHILDSPVTIFTGLLKAIGKPKVGALVFGIFYCLVTFPVAVPLMFLMKFGMKGFWIGITVGFTVINIFFIIYFWRTNWQHLTEQAQEHVGLKLEIDSKYANFDEAVINTPGMCLSYKK
ncbi:hypothetical protein GDO86_003766 [Hymenochirus boettgeri]|uniref:Uncharacterized protein n=1 Tax=Hymenochirus boettgeri TaxID=247094 RepID=A0A8T2K8M3_9PIPI|nr:hypothetical protein GDO86_003766 [Hymenochirus boettgeri]